MIEYHRDKAAADRLQSRIIKSVVKFIDKDPGRTMLGITATLNAGIHLFKAAQMPEHMRDDIANIVSSELRQSVAHPGSKPSNDR